MREFRKNASMHWRSIDLRGFVSRYLLDHINGLLAYAANGLMEYDQCRKSHVVLPEYRSPCRPQQGFVSGAAQRRPMCFRVCRCRVRDKSPRHPSHPASCGRLTGSKPTSLQSFTQLITPPVRGHTTSLEPQTPQLLLKFGIHKASQDRKLSSY
jgi:hypothetical protein